MKGTKDLTVGNPLKLICSFSFPVLIGFLFQELYHTADTIIVGRLLGAQSLGAVGATSPLIFLVFGFIQGVTAGFAVLTAQAFGSKDLQQLKKSFVMNIKLNFYLSILTTILAVGTLNAILKLINTPTEIFNQSKNYLKIIYLGISASVLYNATACILRAIGDSKTPLLFLIFSSILNIVLDVVFIKTFTNGVEGAALATVISQAIAGIGCAIFIKVKFPQLKITKSDIAVDVPVAKSHIKIGIPMGIQFSITAIGSIILQSSLNNFGAFAIAGFSAAQKVEHLVTIAANTFGVTVANFTGQNIGAKRLDRVEQGIKTCVWLSALCAAFSMLIALCFPEQISALFIQKGTIGYDEVIKASKEFLFWCSLCFYPLYLIFIFRNALQAMGYSFIPLMGGVTELLSRSLCAIILPTFIGYTGICVAGSIAWFLAATLLFISYICYMKKKREGI